MPLSAGDAFPEGVVFKHSPITPENSSVRVCSLPQNYNASTEFKDKKVVLVSVPGAFTPTCSQSHLPGYLENLAEIKKKGVDAVIFIAYNDPFVMAGWGKSNGISDDSILFMSDVDAAFSKSLGWNLGERTARYVVVVDHGKVVYAGIDKEPGSLANSGPEAALARL